MLQVARLAPQQLADAATAVEAFLRGQFHDDGGGRDRAGASDLYYTVFALDGLLALQAEPPRSATEQYLTGFGDGDGLDFVHLACLARCWASLGAPPSNAASIARHIERFRCGDGGYSSAEGADGGNVYHSFMAVAAYQDLGVSAVHGADLVDCIARQRAADGGYSNAAGHAEGVTTVTAAAVTLLHQLQQPIPRDAGSWLLAQAHRDGGFVATPRTPMPDLLSTATALHALAAAKVDFSALREPCLEFIDSLWTGRAFCGHWADDAQDSEYTYYALLALGHLSL